MVFTFGTFISLFGFWIPAKNKLKELEAAGSYPCSYFGATCAYSAWKPQTVIMNVEFSIRINRNDTINGEIFDSESPLYGEVRRGYVWDQCVAHVQNMAKKYSYVNSCWLYQGVAKREVYLDLNEPRASASTMSITFITGITCGILALVFLCITLCSCRSRAPVIPERPILYIAPPTEISISVSE